MMPSPKKLRSSANSGCSSIILWLHPAPLYPDSENPPATQYGYKISPLSPYTSSGLDHYCTHPVTKQFSMNLSSAMVRRVSRMDKSYSQDHARPDPAIFYQCGMTFAYCEMNGRRIIILSIGARGNRLPWIEPLELLSRLAIAFPRQW
jgi:hypothetical protein